jgi:hypothetical protein
MNQPAQKYGESPKIRKYNGKRLKDIRLQMGLSVKQACELLKLKNAPAVTNAELGCSTAMFEERVERYEKLARKLEKGNRSSAAADPESTLQSSSLKASSMNSVSVRTLNGNNDSLIKTRLLELAVKRLALVNNKSETDIWLDLFEESAKS